MVFKGFFVITLKNWSSYDWSYLDYYSNLFPSLGILNQNMLKVTPPPQNIRLEIVGTAKAFSGIDDS